MELKASFTEGKVMEQLSVDIAAKVQWSDWTHCESSFNLVLVPHLPGVYALAEELTECVGENDEDWQSLSPQERELAARVQLLVPEPIRKRRKLMIFVINETGNLAYAISSLFSLGNPVGEHLAHSQCYVRYAVIEDAEQRHAVSVRCTRCGPVSARQQAVVMRRERFWWEPRPLSRGTASGRSGLAPTSVEEKSFAVR